MSNINLLPWRTERIVYKNNLFYLILSIALISMMFFIFLVKIYIEILATNLRDGVQYLNSEISIYQNKTKEITGLKERRTILLNRIEVINSLQAKRFNVVDILDKVAKSVPSGIILSLVSSDGNYMKISGIAESNSSISVFMKNLENFEVFSSPKLEEIKVDQPSGEQLHSGISFLLGMNVLG